MRARHVATASATAPSTGVSAPGTSWPKRDTIRLPRTRAGKSWIGISTSAELSAFLIAAFSARFVLPWFPVVCGSNASVG